MSLKFEQQPVPQPAWHAHLRSGGISLRRYVARVRDGYVQLYCGLETLAESGQPVWHASISHCTDQRTKDRLPTEDEVAAALARVPRSTPWRAAEIRDNVRHYWADTRPIQEG